MPQRCQQSPVTSLQISRQLDLQTKGADDEYQNSYRAYSKTIKITYFFEFLCQGRNLKLMSSHSNNCTTMKLKWLEFRFRNDTRLSLAKRAFGLEATVENLTAGLDLDQIVGYLKLNLIHPIVFNYGYNWDPKPLANVEAPVEVDICMDVNAFKNLYIWVSHRTRS